MTSRILRLCFLLIVGSSAAYAAQDKASAAASPKAPTPTTSSPAPTTTAKRTHAAPVVSTVTPPAAAAPATPQGAAAVAPAPAVSTATAAPSASSMSPAATNIHTDGNVAAGKALSTACVACHGEDGNSINPIWPKIAGQHEQYLYEQLVEIKKGAAGKRNVPLMLGIVGPLSDDDLKNLAAYFAVQKMTEGKADASLLALGEKIYREGNPQTGVPACMACHQPDGLGNGPAKFPRVGGQYAEYLKAELKDYAAGTRKTGLNNIMQTISAKLSEKEMDAVTSYMQGLHAAHPEKEKKK